MTNKEKMRKAMSKDVDKETNYNAIIKKIERGYEMNKVFKYVIPICLVAIICSIFILNSTNFSFNVHNSDIGNDKNHVLNINKIDDMGLMRFDADIKVISLNGQMIPWPDILKDGITIPKDLDKSNAYAIYTRKDINSDYDYLNCYVYHYFNTESGKSIRIAFSKTDKPIRDYFFDSDGNISTINNIELTIFQYENSYFTEFSYKDYNFDIETDNISVEELTLLLESIVK